MGSKRKHEAAAVAEASSPSKKIRSADTNGNPVLSEKELKRLRKEEKKKRKAEKSDTEAKASETTETETKSEEELKRERKAAKKAKKEGKKSSEPEVAQVEVKDTDNGKKLSKEERKAKKAAKKAKLVEDNSIDSSSDIATKASAVSTAAQSQQESSATSPDPETSGSGEYSQHSTLTALPQADVDKYLNEHAIKFVEPLKSQKQLRPITKFDYTPSFDISQQKAFATFTAPTPIQAATWPYLFSGRDVVGVAETGSGKTLAFGVPCIRKISALPKNQRKGIKAVIVSPTRELACQIFDQLVTLATPLGLNAVCIYGGVPKDQQRNDMQKAHIVVATPGRLNDFLSEGSCDLSGAQFACLDEADRMLDKGFEEEVKKILSATAPLAQRQTVMFTATWPQSVRNLAATYMNTPVQIYIGRDPSGELQANTRIEQIVEVMEPRAKEQRLINLLREAQKKGKNDRILIFCLYKKEATRVEQTLYQRGFNVAGIHGDLSQEKRTKSLDAFKRGDVPLLVATDVAARGLDIPAVKLVINMTFPLTAEDYVHRIGRTGRAGQLGKAITFFTEHEKHLSGQLINVLKQANQPVPQELLKFGTTVKKKEHSAYGAFFKDVDTEKKATKITFD